MTLRLAIALTALILTAQPCLAEWGHGHWQGHYGGHERPYGPHGGPGVGGVVGGIIAGNIISRWIFGPPQQQTVVVQQPAPELVPGTPAWYAYCANKYRSFDAQTGTYLGFDGQRHPCS